MGLGMGEGCGCGCSGEVGDFLRDPVLRLVGDGTGDVGKTGRGEASQAADKDVAVNPNGAVVERGTVLVTIG
jgi:hypothetical protein